MDHILNRYYSLSIYKKTDDRINQSATLPSGLGIYNGGTDDLLGRLAGVVSSNASSPGFEEAVVSGNNGFERADPLARARLFCACAVLL